jgi:RimJ/RimL family protein N-acetyltransferase
VIAAVPLLVGEKVMLRPYSAGFTTDELQALYRWARDPGLLALSGGSVVEMRFERFQETFLSQLDRHNGPTEQLFALLDPAQRMIGRVGLFGMLPGAGGELGIVIGERDCWNQGYGRDAVRTITTYGFEELKLPRIVLYTFVENERAQRAFRACGFRVVRRLRRFSFEKGVHSELEMELLAPQS